MDIQEVKSTIEQELPDCWLPLEACLSAVGAAMLKDVSHCVGLILVGGPGGRKGTTLSMLGSDEPIYRLNDFTPASFVSADANKPREELAENDLLPQIKHKVLIVDELAPMLSKRYEDLVNSIGILTSVMDGKGYWKATGTHGRRGYEGDYRFSMICGTTPPEHKVWQALGKLSSRWIFYNLGELSPSRDIRKDYGAASEECKRVVGKFMEEFWQGYATVDWDRMQDSKTWTDLLGWSAHTMCRWRGLIQKQDSVGYNPALVEVPYRLEETLYALARGHALLWGRKQIDWNDVCFAIDINQTNMPEDRHRLFRAFDRKMGEHINNGGRAEDMLNISIGTTEAVQAIECSKGKAEYVLRGMEDLGILERDESGKWKRKV